MYQHTQSHIFFKREIPFPFKKQGTPFQGAKLVTLPFFY
jgi:hypothetical protein